MRLSTALALIVVLLLGLATIQRNRVWASPIAVWSDSAVKSPENVRAWMNLAVAERQDGDLPMAAAGFDYVMSHFPGDAQAVLMARINRAAIGMLTGRMPEAQLTLEQLIIEHQAEPSEELLPAYSDLAFIYREEGRYADALALLDTLVTMDSGYMMNTAVNFNRAQSLKGLHRCAESDAAFRLTHSLDASIPIEACP